MHSPAAEHPHGGRPQEHSALPHATVADDDDAAGSKAEPCGSRIRSMMITFACLDAVLTEDEVPLGPGAWGALGQQCTPPEREATPAAAGDAGCSCAASVALRLLRETAQTTELAAVVAAQGTVMKSTPGGGGRRRRRSWRTAHM